MRQLLSQSSLTVSPTEPRHLHTATNYHRHRVSVWTHLILVVCIVLAVLPAATFATAAQSSSAAFRFRHSTGHSHDRQQVLAPPHHNPHPHPRLRRTASSSSSSSSLTLADTQSSDSPCAGAVCDHRLANVNVTRPLRGPSLLLSALPGVVDVTEHSAVVKTSSDLRPFLKPGSVLQLDGHMPCEVDGGMTAASLTIAHPYRWSSKKDASVAVTNLERLLGLEGNAKKGSDRVSISGATPANPVLPGDTLFVEGTGPLLVMRVTENGAAVFVSPPFPGQGGPKLRLFRVKSGGDTGMPSVPMGEDAESVIDRVAKQAQSLFGSSHYGDVGGVKLPGWVATTFNSQLMHPSVDWRPYLRPGTVLKVGRRFPFVVDRQPPMTATDMYVTSVWAGASEPRLPGIKTRLSLLPGAVNVVHGSKHVETSADLRAMLSPNTVVVIDVIPNLVVAATPAMDAGSFSLTAPYPGPTASDVPIFHAGMTLLPATATVTHDSATVVMSGDVRPLLRLYDVLVFGKAVNTLQALASTAPDQFTASRLTITPAFSGSDATLQPVYRTGQRLLPGTVSVTRNSPVVLSTADLRPVLLPGDEIMIAEFPVMVVAGGEFGSADGAPASVGPAVVGPQSFQIMQLFPFKSASGLRLMATGLRRLPTLVTVIRDDARAVTTSDVSDYLTPGSIVRIGPFTTLAVAAKAPDGSTAVSPKGFYLVGGFPGASLTRVPLYLNTGAMGSAGARAGRADGSDSPHVLGLVDVVKNSPYATSHSDLSQRLAAGDVVRISDQTHSVVAERPTRTTIRLTLPYGGPTAKSVPLSLITRRVKLTGTVTVTHGEPTALTSQDLRSELAVGDVVEIERLKFVVVSPFDGKSFGMSEQFSGPSAAGVFAYRVIGGSGTGLLMPGTVSVVHGQALVETTEDLSGSVSRGDRLRIGLHEVVATEPINRLGLTMAAAWPGRTARGLRVYNLGKSGREASLEELAMLKLQCRSIYCLAKIEEQERAIPTAFTRSLNAGQAAMTNLGVDAVKKLGTHDGLLVDKSVEDEWKRWYEKAKARLAAPASITAAAPQGAKERVKELYKK